MLPSAFRVQPFDGLIDIQLGQLQPQMHQDGQAGVGDDVGIGEPWFDVHGQIIPDIRRSYSESAAAAASQEITPREAQRRLRLAFGEAEVYTPNDEKKVCAYRFLLLFRARD